MPQTTLSKNLTNLRLSNNISEDEITRISGKSWISWCKYESGEAKPPKTVLERISRHFKIPVEELLGDTTLPKRKSPAKASTKATAKKAETPMPSKPEPAPEVTKETAPEITSKEQSTPLELYIQASDGREISLSALYSILKQSAPNAENVYVKPDENRAYWTAPRGQKGSFELY